MARILLLALPALCVPYAAAQEAPAPDWLAAGGPLQAAEGLDGFWLAPAFRPAREEIRVADPEVPRLPAHRDAGDRAFAGLAAENMQAWLQRQFPGAPPARYRLDLRIVDVSATRRGAVAAAQVVPALLTVPMLAFPPLAPIFLPSVLATEGLGLAATREWLTFEARLVDPATGATVAALHHTVRRLAGTLDRGLEGALASFLGQLGFDPRPPTASGPPPWGAAAPFPAQKVTPWVWTHPDLAARLGPVAVRPWPAPAPPLKPGALNAKERLRLATDWSGRMPGLLGKALRRHLGPRLAERGNRPPLVLEGRIDLACTHLRQELDEDGNPVGQVPAEAHPAYQVALRDPASGEVLAAAECPLGLLATGTLPFPSATSPQRWSGTFAERLAAVLPAAPWTAPEPWFPEGTPWRKDLKGVDRAWFAPGFTLAGRTLWVQPWDDPAVDPGRRDANDFSVADDFTDLAPATLVTSLARALPEGAALSRRHGDLALQGRIVDLSIAGTLRAATIGILGGAGSTMVLELRVVDLHSGAVLAGIHHRLVSMTGAMTGPGTRSNDTCSAFLVKFGKFSDPLAKALAAAPAPQDPQDPQETP